MNKGILIYAHNNRTIDYAALAIISAGLAKKSLEVPASLITDASTVSWMQESDAYSLCQQVFEQVILVDRPAPGNQRRLHDGATVGTVPFANSNRHTAWQLTPYDRTLLIDSDYLVFSNHLGEYWNVDSDVMLGAAINDICAVDRLGFLDRHVSAVGVKMYWATTVMFTKNHMAQRFFACVEHVYANYKYFADIFRFDPTQFRNDIAFSVAKHVLDGFEESVAGSLPPVLSVLDKDILYSVEKNKLTFLVDISLNQNYCLAAVSGADVHVMNKQSIIRNQTQLLELI